MKFRLIDLFILAAVVAIVASLRLHFWPNDYPGSQFYVENARNLFVLELHEVEVLSRRMLMMIWTTGLTTH
jgi:hypothetical protein